MKHHWLQEIRDTDWSDHWPHKQSNEYKLITSVALMLCGWLVVNFPIHKSIFFHDPIMDQKFFDMGIEHILFHAYNHPLTAPSWVKSSYTKSVDHARLHPFAWPISSFKAFNGML